MNRRRQTLAIALLMAATAPVTAVAASGGVALPLPRGEGQPFEVPAATDSPRSLEKLFAIWGFGDEYWRTFADVRPWQPEETAALTKLLYRLRAIEPWRIAEADQGPFRWTVLTTDSPARRGQVFTLAGEVRAVQPVELPSAEAASLGFARYYRVEVDVAGRPAVLFASELPKVWLGAANAAERFTAEAIYLKFEKAGDAARPVFAAQRLARRDDTLLSRLGMDVGLLDTVVDRRPLAGAESDAFYAMMQAVGHARPGELRAAAEEQLAAGRQAAAGRSASDNAGAAPPGGASSWIGIDPQGRPYYSVVPLFNDPQSQRGRLYLLTGTARQVLKVMIEDPALAARLGFDHYFQIALFTADSQGQPLIFCVRELPEGLPVGDAPQFAETLSVAGFFLKVWAYRIEIPRGMEAEPGPRTQLAPLLIGERPVWVRQPPASSGPLSAGGVTVMILMAAVAIVAILWRQRRTDRQLRELRERLARDDAPTFGPPWMPPPADNTREDVNE